MSLAAQETASYGFDFACSSPQNRYLLQTLNDQSGKGYHYADAEAAQSLSAIPKREGFDMILTLRQPGKSGQSTQTHLRIKESIHGLVHEVGTFTIDHLAEPVTLSVQPYSLRESLFGRQVLISAFADDDQLVVFRDRLIGFDGLNLRLEARDWITVALIHEFVLLTDDENSAPVCDPRLPVPLLPISGVMRADLPRFMSKTCLVWYRDSNGSVKACTDCLHAWYGDHLSFRHRPPILLQDILHILPLEESGPSTCRESALPEYDPETIDRSIP